MSIERTQALEEANNNVEIAKAVERLFVNPDFKKVVVDLFIRESLITSSLDYANCPEQYRPRLLERISARGHLNSFLMELIEEGNKAVKAIEYMNEEISQEMKGE